MDTDKLGGAGNMIDPEVIIEANSMDTTDTDTVDTADAAGVPGTTPEQDADSARDDVDEIFAGDDADEGDVQTGARKSELYDNSGDMAGAENTTGADVEDLAG